MNHPPTPKESLYASQDHRRGCCRRARQHRRPIARLRQALGLGPHGGLGFAIGALTFMAATAAANSAAYSSCLQEEFVQTPRGYYKKVIVNVCDQ